jgi:aspartyl-tRNA(Asn)/glutamyl-tRNA(Gln) amidotransferase subunit A
VPNYEAGLDGDLRGLRIGIPSDGLLGSGPAAARVYAATEVLAARGARLMPVHLPYMEVATAYLIVIFRSEGTAIHDKWMRELPTEYAAHLSAKLYSGYAVPASQYVEALRARGPILRAFAAEVFDKVHVIALPTIPVDLPTLAETDIDTGPVSASATTEALSVNTRAFNYFGLPAISIPSGFDPNGLPIGLQIVGRPFAEGLVLKVADAYQRETDWHTRMPPLRAASSTSGRAPAAPPGGSVARA